MRPPLTYYGGKQLLAKIIVPLLPKHKIYCEVCFGGGAVFFEKSPSYLEVINDIDDKLITFYLQLQNNYDNLQNVISHTICSETLHKAAKRIYNDPSFSSDLEIAWAVWMTTNGSFLGTPHGGWKWCNGSAGSHTAIVLNNKRKQLSEQLHERLKNVQISSRDLNRVISDRDTEETIFYIDTPYVGTDQKHYVKFSVHDLDNLLINLHSINGKFILSSFWCQTLRFHVLLNDWHVIAINSHMKVSNLRKRDGKLKHPKSKTEILVMNFFPETNSQLKLDI